VYCRPGTSVGFENTSVGWTLAATGTGVSAEPSLAMIDTSDFALAPGLYGIALISSGDGHRYTSFSNTYMNADVRIDAGKASNVPWVSPIASRTWNGCLFYSVGGSPASWTTLNQTGCPLNGTEPSVNLAAGQLPITGATWTFEFHNGPASGNGFVAMGFQQIGVPLDLGIVGAQAGCSLGINPIVFAPNVALDGTGFGTYNLNIRHDPSAHGVTMLVQGLTPVFAQPFPLPVFTSDTYAALVGSN
jgi:hypothetical protein